MSTWNGSFAQNQIQMTTQVTQGSTPGAQYGKAMIFVDHATLVTLWPTSPPAAGTDQELNSTNYSSFVTGALLTILQSFFASNNTGTIFIAAWDATVSDNAGMTTAYNAVKLDAYYKTIYVDGISTEAAQNAAQVFLAALCYPDIKAGISYCGLANKYADMLTVGSTTSLVYGLLQDTVATAAVIYDDTGSVTDAWLDQLGLTLGNINQAGTTVANALSQQATTNRKGSGVSGANLSAVSIAALKEQDVGYWQSVDATSGTYCLFCPQSLKGNADPFEGSGECANFVGWFTFVCRNYASDYLTNSSTPQGKQWNTGNYLAILAILANTVAPYVGLGIITNFTSRGAPAFSPSMKSGGIVTIPNAWAANFNGQINGINISGNLGVNL